MNIVLLAALAAFTSPFATDIQTEIQRVADDGGGRVVIPAGEWRTGALELGSNVELHLEEGAELVFPDEPSLYPLRESVYEGLMEMRPSPLVGAFGATNVAVTGRGTLRAETDYWMANRKTVKRPCFLQFVNCAKVRLEDIRIRNSPAWTMHFSSTDDVTVRGVDSRALGANNDGIDLESVNGALIENCCLDQGDDAICMKSGKNEQGRRRNRPTRNVVVRNCTVANGHTLLALGSELSGGIENVTLEDCRVTGEVWKVVRVKTNRARGGYVRNIKVRNVDVRRATNSIFEIYSTYQASRAENQVDSPFLTPIENITIENVTCDEAWYAYDLLGDELMPPRGIVMRNCRVKKASRGTGRVENIDGFKFENDVIVNETADWQARIDAASEAGGGRVVVPAGVHPVAELELKSNVTLELAEGARLAAVNDYSLYRWQPGLKAELQRTGVLVAYGATNIAVVGRGVIDGGGESEPKTTKRAVRWRNIYFEDCRGVEISEVQLENPAFWTCFLRRCDTVHVKGVKIRAISNYNNDGLDLCVSNALIEDCDIVSEDDSIVMKNFDPDWVSEKVEIRNCRVSSNASYIKFGTETEGVLRDYDIHDCEIVARAASFWRKNVGRPEWPGLDDPRHGTGGLVFLMVDGGILENVRVRDITMRKGVCVPIVFRLGRRRGQENWSRSAMRNITLERIRMTDSALCGVGNFISGVPGLEISGVTIRDSSFKMKALAEPIDWRHLFFEERESGYPGAGIFGGPMPSHFLYSRHANNVRLENVTVEVCGEGETRPAVVSDDVGAVTVQDCAFRVTERTPVMNVEKGRN